ncbi:MAG: TIGR04282 family arsenosugar biosynthesis glycosyltransferase [Bacteroidota bacterium]
MNQQALIIFVKNPEKGKVKTRLASTVGDERALKIYLALLAHTRNIALAISAKRYLFYSAYVDQQDDWPNGDFQKTLQHNGDLGARMEAAFADCLAENKKVVIIGSDCASLTATIVQEAFSQLDKYDLVIGPALDGGYYLLGMKTPHPFLFQSMVWSTESVFQETINRITAASLTYATLPTLSDIDYEEDWEKYGWNL